MAVDCQLSMLSPELQLQLLLEATTPQDLHALIRSSPRLFQVFKLNKQKILSAVSRRLFHPAVLPEALSFAKLSQLEQPLSRGTAEQFIDIDPEKLREWQKTMSSISESVALCQLASNLRFFNKDFARNTLPIMYDWGKSLDVTILPEYTAENPTMYWQLSKSEIGRLQRAFCRFEIYRYIFARCFSGWDHDVESCPWSPLFSPAEQASLFLERLPDFQIDEIHCIRDYLARRFRGIFDQLEDEAVNTLSPKDFTVYGPSDELGDTKFYLFTERGRNDQDGHVEYLMSLGLPYIRRIYESTGEQKRDLFLCHVCPFRTGNHSLSHHHFITRALERLGRNPARGDLPFLAETDPPFEYQVDTRVELDIPDAWQWAHPSAPPMFLSGHGLKGLRDWGFVFWDLDRLRKSGILDRSSEDVQRVAFRANIGGMESCVELRVLKKHHLTKPPSPDREEDVDFTEFGRIPFGTDYYDDSSNLNFDESLLEPQSASSSSQEESDEDHGVSSFNVDEGIPDSQSALSSPQGDWFEDNPPLSPNGSGSLPELNMASSSPAQDDLDERHAENNPSILWGLLESDNHSSPSEEDSDKPW